RRDTSRGGDRRLARARSLSFQSEAAGSRRRLFSKPRQLPLVCDRSEQPGESHQADDAEQYRVGLSVRVAARLENAHPASMNWAAKRFFGSRVPACHPDASQTPVGRAGKNDGADEIGENDGADEIEKNDGADQIEKNDPADEIIYVTDVYDLALAHRDTSHCDVPHILLC